MNVPRPPSLAVFVLLIASPVCAEPIRLALVSRSVGVSLRTPEGGVGGIRTDADSLHISLGSPSSPTAHLASNLANPSRIVATGSATARSTSTHRGTAQAALGFEVGFERSHVFRLFLDVTGGEESSDYRFAGVELFFRLRLELGPAPAPVPEPTSLVLAATGLAGVLRLAGRRKERPARRASL